MPARTRANVREGADGAEGRPGRGWAGADRVGGGGGAGRRGGGAARRGWQAARAVREAHPGRVRFGGINSRIFPEEPPPALTACPLFPTWNSLSLSHPGICLQPHNPSPPALSPSAPPQVHPPIATTGVTVALRPLTPPLPHPFPSLVHAGRACAGGGVAQRHGLPLGLHLLPGAVVSPMDFP